MTTKEYLHRVLDQEYLLRAKQKELEAVRGDIASVRGSMSQDGGGGKGNGADIGNLICRLEKYEIIVQKEITKLVTLKAKARHIIEYLDDGKARAVLHNRYLNNMTWEQIAVEMGYSWRQMHRVHAAALRQLDSDKRVQRIKKMS